MRFPLRWKLSVAVLLLTPRPSPAAPPPGIREFRRAHEEAIVKELAELVALPNVASDGPGVERNAERLVAMLKKRGLAPRLLRVEGAPPAVFGERRVPGAKSTVLLYAHYDGQPAVAAEWQTPPWTPVLRLAGREVPLAAPFDPEARLHGRSSSDDKAPIVAMLAALDALAASGRAPAVNLKLLFEGEEEKGSPHLRELLGRHRELLACDLLLLCDGPVHQSRRPLLYLGARGVTDLEVTVYGPSKALHSGHYGSWAPNPALLLAHLLASLRGADGTVLVRGFQEDVRPPTAAERSAAAAAPDVEAELRASLGLAADPKTPPLAEGLLLPAINVRGMSAGHVGAEAQNAVPTEARASLDFRLVPDQTPENVRRRVEEHLAAGGWTVVHEAPGAEARARPRLVLLQWGHGYPPARTPLDAPAAQRVVRVARQALGDVVVLPTLGGSIPMYVFQEVLGAPVVGVPIVNHDNNQHAANENLRLQNLWDGLELFAALFLEL